jgi:hypothetical protein
MTLAGTDTDEAPEGGGLLAVLEFRSIMGQGSALEPQGVVFSDSADEEDVITEVSGGMVIPTQVPIVLPVVEDAFIRPAPNADQNFNEFPFLSVLQGCPESCQNHAEALLKFEVSEVDPADVASATLKLYLSESGALETTGLLRIQPVLSNEWHEESVTWNTAPPGPDWSDQGGELAMADPVEGSGKWIDFDLSTAMREATTDDFMSLRVVTDGVYQHGGYFHDKEYEDEELHPHLLITLGASPRFVRGDVDVNGSIELTDGIRLLGNLFLGRPEPVCLDAADINDDGLMDISDAISIFQWLFLGGAPPRAPSPSATAYDASDCGQDSTEDSLDCQEFNMCP